jgi:4'-phosphopantetheinyl transferase
MPETRWMPPPERPRIAAGTVDVWRADLARGGQRECELLSSEERARAARFVRADAGRRWAAARGILRALLGAYADVAPAALRFAEGPHGKPRIASWSCGTLGGQRLRFNVSHSGDVALYAVALEREVGIDVELPHRAVDHVAIARRIFGEREAERLAGLDPAVREREFLRAWVRYEAVVKCRGTGIGGAVDPSAAAEPWVRELDVGPAAAAALAVEGGTCSVRCWQWPAAGA